MLMFFSFASTGMQTHVSLIKKIHNVHNFDHLTNIILYLFCYSDYERKCTGPSIYFHSQGSTKEMQGYHYRQEFDKSLLIFNRVITIVIVINYTKYYGLKLIMCSESVKR
jgi:hypothetical protein